MTYNIPAPYSIIKHGASLASSTYVPWDLNKI